MIMTVLLVVFTGSLMLRVDAYNAIVFDLDVLLMGWMRSLACARPPLCGWDVFASGSEEHCPS